MFRARARASIAQWGARPPNKREVSQSSLLTCDILSTPLSPFSLFADAEVTNFCFVRGLVNLNRLGHFHLKCEPLRHLNLNLDSLPHQGILPPLLRRPRRESLGPVWRKLRSCSVKTILNSNIQHLDGFRICCQSRAVLRLALRLALFLSAQLLAQRLLSKRRKPSIPGAPPPLLARVSLRPTRRSMPR